MSFKSAKGESMEAPLTKILRSLEARENEERAKGDQLSLDERLLAIGPEAGALLAQMIKSLNSKSILELGTSYGYSTLWLADAARAVRGRVVSIDLVARKQAQAHAALCEAGLEELVEFHVGPAEVVVPSLGEHFDFVLIDVWAEAYVACLDAVWPQLDSTAVIVADNMTRPKSDSHHSAAYRRAIGSRAGIESLMLPIGNGLEISCYRSIPAAVFLI
jgi:predicted O-methyltransferase YrrM